MRLETIYLTAAGMEESIEFWEDVLQQPPAEQGTRHAHFALEGMNLGLYNAASHDGTIEFGDNCVPSFQTKDLEAEHTRIRDLAPFTEDIIKGEDYKYFHFEDPAGNLVEVYEDL